MKWSSGAVGQRRSGAVVQCLELWTLDLENLGLNPGLPCQAFERVFHSALLHLAIQMSIWL